MTYTVCVITGTRAEFGLLTPLLMRLREEKDIDLQLTVTGAHLVKDFGNTVEEIEKTGLPIYKRVPIEMQGDSRQDMALATGKALYAFADYFAENRPDLLVVLGDRFEIFAAAAAAAMEGIVIAHIHGGEVTEGAVDDFLRHAVTKMSQLHFTACETYRRRVIQLGEEPDRVFNVGALGVENVLHLPQISREDLAKSLDFDLNRDYAIVTFHPETNTDASIPDQMHELISAMEAHDELSYIITKANADAGGREINTIWDKEEEKHTNWKVVYSLGAKRYLTALKHAQMMIGNSSSGILEAPSVHIPTINIGARQNGRMMAESVICCECTADAIVKAMDTAMSEEFRKITEEAESPFGDGKTSALITETIMRYLRNNSRQTQKQFYDLEER